MFLPTFLDKFTSETFTFERMIVSDALTQNVLYINFESSKVIAPLVENDLKQFWSQTIDTFNKFFEDKGIEQLWKNVRPKIADKIQSECLSRIDSLTKNWYDNEASTKMFLSTGFSAIPAGIMLGTTVELGDFDACVKINDPHNGLVGQYCLATLNIPRTKLFSPTNISEILTSQPRWKSEMIQKWYDHDNHFKLARGFCSPSECNSQDLHQIFQNVFPLLNSFDLNIESCQTMNEKPHDSRIWIPVSIILLSIMFVIIGTLYSQLVNERKESRFDGIVRSFDAKKNLQNLLDLSSSKTSSGKVHLDCIDGLRVLWTIFIVLAHVIANGQIAQASIMQIGHFPYVVHDQIKPFAAQIFGQGNYSMSYFFGMASILLAYTSLKQDSPKESFIGYLIRRWARYVPSIIGTICMLCVLELLGDGPLFHHDNLKTQTSPCYDYWWKNVFFIQNFYPINTQCLQQGWFLAVEFQLRILSYILLLVYARFNARVTILLIISAIILGPIAHLVNLILIGEVNILPTLLFPQFTHYSKYIIGIYPQMIKYIEVYAIGFLIGLFLFEKRKYKFTFKKNIPFFTIGILSMLYSAFYTYELLKLNRSFDENPTIFTLFGLALAHLFYSIFCGYTLFYLLLNASNPVSQLLSHKYFKPLSKLSFCVYLIHMPVITFNTFQTRYLLSFDNAHNIFSITTSITVTSVIIAIFLHIVFEAPWDRFVKLFKNKPKIHGNKSPEQNVEMMEAITMKDIEKI